MDVIWQAFKKSFVFKGRASRKEYWCFTLFTIVIYIGLVGVEVAVLKTDLSREFSPMLLGASLLLFFPSLSVMVRRFHDTNRSGWYWFIVMIPLVGAILQLVRLAQAGTPGDNDYGPQPY